MKDKEITQPNSQEDEVEEFLVQEKLTAISKMESLVFQIPPTILVSTSLFFNKLEEDNICLICKFILQMNPSKYI